MRFWAVAGSQRRMATCSKSVWPDWTTISPESIIGWRTDMAPLKKKVALLSSGDPANSSTLYGPCAARPSRPSTSDSAWSTPTLKLSKVV